MLRHVFALLFVVSTLCAAPPALAQNFRMETDVYVGSRKTPDCQTLTLFTDSMVYDFIYAADEKNKDDQKIAEVTVFDMGAGRVVLLDVKKSRKAVLTHEQLVQMTTAMKVHVTDKDSVYYFAANPKFESNFLEDKLELTLKSASLTYVVKGQKPEQGGAAWRYQEFADWSARLNACRAGNLPPFARMELSKDLAERGLLPEEITRTTVAPSRLGNKRVEVRSRHHVNWLISTTDRKRIETVAEQIGKFEGITFLSYAEADRVK
jgi:hypothetical protein